MRSRIAEGAAEDTALSHGIVLSLQRVGHQYGTRRALEGASGQVRRGDVLGLVGRNGAGKTTLLRSCAGLIRPTEGRLEVVGRDPYDLAARAVVGYLPEDPGLPREMRVASYVFHMARLSGLSRRTARQRMQESLRLTALEGLERRIIGRLSRGYRQRVALCQALVHRPQLLLLDEPTTGMDPVQIDAFHRMLRSLDQRPAIVLSSHNLHHVAEVCDSVLVIEHGRVVAQGTVSEVEASLGGVEREWSLELRGDEQAALLTIRAAGWQVHSIVEAKGVRRVRLAPPSEDQDPADLVRQLILSGVDVIRVEGDRSNLEPAFISRFTETGSTT